MNGRSRPQGSQATAGEPADRQLLYAYFDLDIAPPGFNITNFLVLADIEREKCDLDGIHVLIVAGSHDGYRKDDVEYPRYNKDWRVRNLVVPACALLASCVSVSVFGTREEAEDFETHCPGPAFPEGYTVAIPTANHQYAAINAAAAAGQRVTRLQPSDQARLYVKKWIEDHAGGRKVVTITLRESTYDLNRNSDLETWSEFARTLDAEVYFPVVIRDTECIADRLPPQLEDLTILPEPAINLDLRAALYEAAYLNTGINQGPWTLWHFIEDIPYLTIYIIDRMNKGWDEFHIHGSGFVKGEDMHWAGPLQRTYWGNDSLAEITREFDEMVARIEGQPTVGAESGGEPAELPATPQSQPEARDPVDLAIGYAQQHQYKSAMDTLVQVLRTDPKNVRAHETLGVLWYEMGQYREAAKHLVEAINLDGADVNRLFSLAGALDKLGKRDDALYWLGLAVAEDPDDVKTRERMGDILMAAGRRDEAIEHFRCLVGITSERKSAQVKLADALMEAGCADEAAGLYSSLLRENLDNATLFLRLGDALAKSDHRDDAMLCFRTSNAVHLGKPLPYSSVLEILDRLAPV